MADKADQTSMTIPATLANTSENEVKVFKDYLATPEGAEILASIEAGYEDLWTIQEIKSSVEDAENATAIMGFLDVAIGNAEGVALDLYLLRDIYAKQLGIPDALNKVAADLQQHRSKERVNALRYGLELMWNSTIKAPKEFCEALVALGMPKTSNGVAMNSYGRISGSGWIRQLLEDVSGHTEAMKQAHAAHGNAHGLKDGEAA